MKSSTYYLRLVTPAFLGSANQQCEWRTPPVKALLRQWWRLLLFSWGNRQNKVPSVEELRQREGHTFGHSWLDGSGDRKWFFRSPLRLVLSSWKSGTLSQLTGERKVYHPEVGGEGGALLYLGYGPLIYDKSRRGTVLKSAPVLEPGDAARATLFWPESASDRMRNLVSALMLVIHWFGACGGRSRNGWGSLQVFDERGEPLSDLQALEAIGSLAVPLKVAIQHDWPCAIGKDDDGPLVWRVKKPFGTWQEAMEEIAKIKIEFRTSLPFTRNRDAAAPLVDKRHLLAYPVTNHGVLEWSETINGRPKLDRQGRLKQIERLANQLRFKVHRVQGSDGKDKFVPIAFHLPHRLPQKLLEKLGPADQHWVRENELGVWKKVHGVLDEKMARLA